MDHRRVATSSGRYQRLCQALKDARVNADLRQIDIAAALEKPQSYIAKVESGERKLDFVETLDYCAVLDLALEDLINVVSNEVNVSIISGRRKIK
jgi:transcriptional regulator with XRE-family HTH domain